jgi:hypothetical protein
MDRFGKILDVRHVLESVRATYFDISRSNACDTDSAIFSEVNMVLFHELVDLFRR